MKIEQVCCLLVRVHCFFDSRQCILLSILLSSSYHNQIISLPLRNSETFRSKIVLIQFKSIYLAGGKRDILAKSSDNFFNLQKLFYVNIMKLSYDEVKSRRSDNIQEEFQRNKRQKLGQDYKILEEELTSPILQSFRFIIIWEPAIHTIIRYILHIAITSYWSYWQRYILLISLIRTRVCSEGFNCENVLLCVRTANIN